MVVGARAGGIAAIVSLVALAGCADQGDSEREGPVVDRESFQLEEGKGAVAGLLVDDRFRPIELVDDEPESEFQAQGFVLLQETGEQVRTNENGEFTFVDLDPGTYTLRAQVSGHEATPQRVPVEEGVFNELSLVARRIANTGSSILTQEFSVFIPCQLSAPAVTVSAGNICTADLSGESERLGFRANYTEFNESITFLVTELKTNKEASADGAVKVIVRDIDAEGGDSGDYYANEAITEGDYIRVWMALGKRSPFDIEDRNINWTNERPFDTQMWAQGQFKEETNALFGATCQAGQFCTADSRGVGGQFGVRGQFIQSLFLGGPEVDIETYCVLCGDA